MRPSSWATTRVEESTDSSPTYVPELRLRVDGELISESHGRAWASGVPLLGIAGNDLHQQTLGSLSETPFLVTQKSIGRSGMSPVWDEPEDGRTALREFAERCPPTRGVCTDSPPAE